MTIIVK